MAEQVSQGLTKFWIVAVVIVLAAGIFLRVWPSAGFKSVGVDEHEYATYVEKAARYGLKDYGRVVDEFIFEQVKRPGALVPATRIGFIWPVTALVRVSHMDPLDAARAVSSASTILLLIVSAILGYRFGGARQMLMVALLMASAPLQLYLAQRSLIDGYFTFLAVVCAWCFLESLRAPQSRAWPIAYGVSLFLLVLTKENAAFICVALLATWICFLFDRNRRPNFILPVVTVVAGAAAVVVLASLLGGLSEWLTFYRLYARKSAAIPYVIRFQDGAWYRYWIDFTLISPGIVALFFARVFKVDRQSRADFFWALFLGFSFLAMSFVPFGLNLRFAAYWDEPLRWLAASELIILGGRFSGRWRSLLLVSTLALVVVGIDLAQYRRFFVTGEIYDPVSSHLLYESKLVK